MLLIVCKYNIAFAEYPSNSSLLYESEMVAVLRCCHMSSEAFVTWQINGTPVVQFSDITVHSINKSGALVNTLMIPATPKYNGVEVVCVAFMDGPPETTPPVVLTIVGGLSE